MLETSTYTPDNTVDAIWKSNELKSSFYRILHSSCTFEGAALFYQLLLVLKHCPPEIEAFNNHKTGRQMFLTKMKQ